MHRVHSKTHVNIVNRQNHMSKKCKYGQRPVIMMIALFDLKKNTIKIEFANLVNEPITSGNSEISFWPRSSLSKQVNLDKDLGNVLSPFSLNSRILSFERRPKFAGKNSRKVSFRYNSEMLSNCVHPSVKKVEIRLVTRKKTFAFVKNVV